MPFTEADYENAIIEVFHNTLGYVTVHGSDIPRDYSSPLYMDELLPSLRRINPKLPEAAITEAVYKLCNFEGGDIVHKNKEFMRYLQNGVTVRYFDNNEELDKLPKDDRNINTLVEIINSMEVREDDENHKNAVDILFDELAEKNPEHFAVRQYAKYSLAAGKTLK